MNSVRLIGLLIYTFGVFAYGTLVVVSIRDVVAGPWTWPAGRLGQRLVRPAQGLLILNSFGWFVVHVLLTLASVKPSLDVTPVELAMLVIVFLFPPLLMHTFFGVGPGSGDERPHRGWTWSLGAMWLVSQSITVVYFLNFFLGWTRSRLWTSTLPGVFMGVLFGIAAVYCVLATARSPRDTDRSDERASRGLMYVLFGITLLLALVMVLANMGRLHISYLVGTAMRSLPLAFLFAGTYLGSRFEFFDLFIKRGLSLMLTIVLLTGYFGLVLPWLEGAQLDWTRPWIYAVVLLPVAAALPWLYRRLGQLLDSYWLGRQFTTVEAVKHFLGGLEDATREPQLVERAERGLSSIFSAPVRIDTSPQPLPTPDFECAEELPIRDGTETIGVIRLGPRANQRPYFSEDLALLGSLGEVFRTVLQNARLQLREREQEERTRELSLHASRSELKALRAQINPHFLFNALNAIAGLIPRDPQRADATVEQSAEVFRYTLRRSDKEWAQLEDEMGFVRSYLDVEQARFGERLEVRMDVEDRARTVRIPTMVIQTLVENAVKHGVAATRGTGRIEIDARCDDARLRIDVTDNGPGFDESGAAQAPGSGFGLKSVRRRLHGHFGDEARLTMRRDETRGVTVVSVDLPLALCAGAA